jgi:biopolymer transport protein ExbD
MKLNRIKKKRGPLILEMTPLVDIVFLLLIFFLVATTFEDSKTGIKIELPTSTIMELQEVKEIQVLITKNKEIILNYRDNGQMVEKKVTKNNLKKILSEKLSKSKEKNVMISGDKNVDYGNIVKIMTIVKEAGATSLDIDTTLGQ